MIKQNLSEDDTSAKFITPALYEAGWAEAAIRRQVAFTAGRIIVRGKLVTRGKAKRADYVLYIGHFPIALIEAKHNFKAVGDGMQQALDYAATLDIPFVFSSNGHGFVLHDRTGTSVQLETTLKLDDFPSPAELWSSYLAWKGLTPAQEQVVKQPYFDDGSGKEPRYYQRNAVNAAVEIVGRGTRVHEDTRKYYFTLIDFRKATNHFADPDFDGEPVQIYEPGEGDPVMPPELPEDSPLGAEDAPPATPAEDETVVAGYPPPDISLPQGVAELRPKYFIQGRPVKVLTERVEYLDENGKLVKAMREVVLDAAFQGTLTTQDSNDGNGRDLIESIVQKSLNAVVNDKKKSKKTSTVIERDAEPAFPTPSTWGWASLQILCEQIGDIDHKMPRAVDIGVPFLSARDLKDGGVLDFSNPKYISEEDFTRLSRKVLPMRNDIIYSRIGARLGKARLVEVDTRFLISYSCCLIRPKHEFIDKRYLQIFLDSHLALQQAHSGVQSIGVPDLGLGEIKAYRIPVPPLAEQHRIVAKVDELMALCDQLDAQLTTTQTDSRRLLEAVLEAALIPVN